ncbi:MAG TPA: hypothetical protein EYP85_08580 [Armatimonadetes bacterium]|nr:hypothetical protein [Armatimonadota bacterium]
MQDTPPSIPPRTRGEEREAPHAGRREREVVKMEKIERAGAESTAYARLWAALRAVSLDTSLDIVKLEGDVSTRMYFRVQGEGVPAVTGKEPTLVAMVLPQPEETKPLPFLEVRDYLERCGLRMLQVYHYDRARGVLLLEDLRDCLFEDYVRGVSGSVLGERYREAVDLLVEMQVRTMANPDPGCIAFQRAFDEERYGWELRRFLRYVVQGPNRPPLAPEDATDIKAGFQHLIRVLCAEPKIFVHRDYHCRNLMVCRGELHLIDFQDARLGPAQYDLASLLRDSYVVLPKELREELLEYYLTHPAWAPGHWREGKHFRRLFDLTSIQRNMHAAACFAWLAADCGVTRYLQYLPGTLGYLGENLAKYRELTALRRALSRYVPELVG